MPNVLFVCHGSLESNSGIHVSCLMKSLQELGICAAAATPKRQSFFKIKKSVRSVGFSRALRFRFPNKRGPDLIHAWTPRQHVVRMTRALCRATGSPYVVHLEDNEHFITAAHQGLTVQELLAKSSDADRLALPRTLGDPVEMQEFIASSSGASMLIDRLSSFVPRDLPQTVFWPSAEDDLFVPVASEPELKRKLGIREAAHVIVYNGNVHAANLDEVRTLYLAVLELTRRAYDVVLVRLGADHVPVLEREALRDRIIYVPFVPRQQVPRYLALADILVQPGKIDDFNSFRFPSKLPEFFAVGRPVILPATNIGLHVTPDKHALLLYRGDSTEIANCVSRILSDPKLRETLAHGGREFYEQNLSWKKSAHELIAFYRKILRL